VFSSAVSLKAPKDSPNALIASDAISAHKVSLNSSLKSSQSFLAPLIFSDDSSVLFEVSSVALLTSL